MADKAVFLDRDDTLIEDPGYINSPGQVKLIPGVADALVQLRKMGYKLIVVSNQSAVARGIVTEATLKKIHKRVNELLGKGRAHIDKFYYCPYHPEGVIPKYRIESDLRKPAAGMFFLASEEMGIDCSRSWMVGNSYRDVTAGRRAGCGAILIKSSLKPAMKKLGDPEPDKIAINMKEVVNIIKMYDWDAAGAGDIQPPPLEPVQEVEQTRPEPVQEVQAPEPEPIIEPDQREYETDEPAIEDWPNAEQIIQHQTAIVPTEEPSPPSPTPAAKTTGQTINIERTNALL